jgi:hypothetical protein
MDNFRVKRIEGRQAGLESEVLQEIAEALGNAGERVEKALSLLRSTRLRIEALKRDLEKTRGQVHRQGLFDRLEEEVAQYNALRDKAVEHYRNLIIHREAVGFRNHKPMEEQYKIPHRIENLHG